MYTHSIQCNVPIPAYPLKTRPVLWPSTPVQDNVISPFLFTHWRQDSFMTMYTHSIQCNVPIPAYPLKTRPVLWISTPIQYNVCFRIPAYPTKTKPDVWSCKPIQYIVIFPIPTHPLNTVLVCIYFLRHPFNTIKVCDSFIPIQNITSFSFPARRCNTIQILFLLLCWHMQYIPPVLSLST